MNKKSIILFFFVLSSFISVAQVDPHFSQYYSFPLWCNPAMTGTSEGSYRATVIYRNQWSSVMVPFSTYGFSGDVATNKNINFGVNLLNQSAGDGGYKYQQANLTVAYSGVKFGANGSHQMSFGFQVGFLGRRFDPTKFQSGDQWNAGVGFDPSIPSGDAFAKSSAGELDLGAGVLYMDASTDKKLNLFAGFSATHLTKPEDPFLNSVSKSFLPMRYTVHVGSKISMSDNVSITPHFLYMTQGSASEKMLGIMGERRLSDAASFFAGANYRIKDAFIPMAGVSINGFSIGTSYDVTISELADAIYGTNSLEISLTWTGGQKGGRTKYNMACPRF